MYDEDTMHSEKIIVERDSQNSPIGVIVAVILILLVVFFVIAANPFKGAGSGDGGQTNINLEAPTPSSGATGSAQ